MINTSVIKNKKLVRLLQSSLKFRSLSEKKQQDHINRIGKMPIKKQEEIVAFLMEENAKETAQKIEKLQRAYEEIISIEKDFIDESMKDRAKMAKK